MDYNMWLQKYWPSLVLAISGVAAAYATFIAAKRDTIQKDEIQKVVSNTEIIVTNTEKITSSNLQLTEDVDSLQKINNALAIKTKSIIASNLSLTKRSAALISKIDLLTTKIDQDAKDREATREKNGSWTTNYLRDVAPNRLEVYIGNEKFSFYSIQDKNSIMLENGLHIPIQIKFDSVMGGYLINATVNDESNNPILIFDKNFFNIHNNNSNTYTFEKDDTRFEVVSNEGMIVFSVKLERNKKYEGKITVKGVFTQRNIQFSLVAGDNGNKMEYSERKSLVPKVKAQIATIFPK